MFANQKIQQTVLDILRKNPQDRGPQEIDLLVNETKGIPFFKGYIDNGQAEVHKMCCLYMKHECILQDNDVFQINTTGTKFYIIITGTVGIYIKLPQTAQELQKIAEEREKKRQMGLQPGPEDEQLTCVKQISEGSFGELALLHNRPRAATIRCHATSHFAILNKKEFDLVLKKAEEDQIIKEMGFFAKLPIFANWNINMIRNIFLNSFRCQFTKGDKIFTEGDPSTAVYIVNAGEFLITKKLNLDDEEETKENTSGIQKLMVKQNGYGQKEIEVTNEKNQIKISLTFDPNLKQIYVVNPPELVGEDDCLNKTNRTYSFICYSSIGEVVMIKRRDFLVRIMTDQDSAKYIKDRIASRQLHIDFRMSNIHKSINVYRHLITEEKMSPLNPKRRSNIYNPSVGDSNQTNQFKTWTSDDVQIIQSLSATQQVFPNMQFKKDQIEEYTNFSPKLKSDQLKPRKKSLHKKITIEAKQITEMQANSLNNNNVSNGASGLKKGQDQVNQNEGEVPTLNLGQNSLISKRGSIISQEMIGIKFQIIKELEIPGSPLKNQPSFVSSAIQRDSQKDQTLENTDHSIIQIRQESQMDKSDSLIDLNIGEAVGGEEGIKFSPKNQQNQLQNGHQQSNAGHMSQIKFKKIKGLTHIDLKTLQMDIEKVQNKRKTMDFKEERNLIYHGLESRRWNNNIMGRSRNVSQFQKVDKSIDDDQMINTKMKFISLDHRKEERDQLIHETMKTDERVQNFFKYLRFTYFQQFNKDRVIDLKAHIGNNIVQYCPEENEGPIEHPYKKKKDAQKLPIESSNLQLLQSYRKEEREKFLQIYNKKQKFLQNQKLDPVPEKSNTVQQVSYAMYQFNKKHGSDSLTSMQQFPNFFNQSLTDRGSELSPEAQGNSSPLKFDIFEYCSLTTTLPKKIQKPAFQNSSGTLKRDASTGVYRELGSTDGQFNGISVYDQEQKKPHNSKINLDQHSNSIRETNNNNNINNSISINSDSTKKYLFSTRQLSNNITFKRDKRGTQQSLDTIPNNQGNLTLDTNRGSLKGKSTNQNVDSDSISSNYHEASSIISRDFAQQQAAQHFQISSFTSQNLLNQMNPRMYLEPLGTQKLEKSASNSNIVSSAKNIKSLIHSNTHAQFNLTPNAPPSFKSQNILAENYQFNRQASHSDKQKQTISNDSLRDFVIDTRTDNIAYKQVIL